MRLPSTTSALGLWCLFALLLAVRAPAAPVWGQEVPSTEDVPVVLVAYYSLTGHTEAMARAAAAAAEGVEGVRVVVRTVDAVEPPDLMEAQGLIVASPTHWANPPEPVIRFLNRLPYLEDVVAGAVATSGNPGGGNEQVLLALLTALLNHGATVVGPLRQDRQGLRFGLMGAVAITGSADPGVSAQELELAAALGHRVATEVLRRR